MGFWTLSIVWYSKKHKGTLRLGVDMLPLSGEGREAPNLLGPLERAGLSH
jgi:hypothetical protein